MCDPLTIASVVASASGGAINAKIQNDAINAANAENQKAMDMESKARRSETARQQEMEALQAQEVTDALMTAKPENIVETAAALAADPANEIVKSADVYSTDMLSGQLENTDIGKMIGEKIADRARRMREILTAQATIGGQNTGFSGVGDALSNTGSQIQTIGSNRRGSVNAAMMETSVPAATVTPNSSPLGDLLMLGGSLGAGLGGRAIGMAGGPTVAGGGGQLLGGANSLNY